MIETAFAQLRFAASLALGVPFSLRSLDRIVEALRATRREFGAVGGDAGELIAGPDLDAETRRAVQLRRFRAQAKHAARETGYYMELFERMALDPGRLSWDDITRLPVTRKAALRERPGAFVCGTARPTFRATSTGTTGRPTSVYFSAHEIATYIALAAIDNLFTGRITEEDIVQVSSSARATLANSCFIGACERVGALVYLAGLVDPAQALALLAEEHRLPGKKPRASILLIYPSYLGELVEAGIALGYRAADFGLERIHVGGEIVTAGLKARCRELFGPVAVEEGFGQTETWPCTAPLCEEGHLHFEPSQGLLEVIDPAGGSPTAPGEIGELVLTPLPPYRTTTPVLRFGSEDLVRALPEQLGCSKRNLPAVSNLLGKRRLAARHEDGWTTPRDVLEALESVRAVPLPARCGFWPVPGGMAVEVLTRAGGPAVRREVAVALEARGVPLRELLLCADRRELRRPYPLRGDLKESSFGPLPTAHPSSRDTLASLLDRDLALA